MTDVVALHVGSAGVRLGAALVLLSVPLAACGGGDSPDLSAMATTVEVRPGVTADVYTPATSTSTSSESVPVVLLVPGGSWQTADRSGLAPLAEQLAAAGSFVVNTTYRAGQDGATFPIPVQDVICSAGFAVAEAADRGLTPGPLVVVGHSAGGHLAALAALAGDTLAALPADDSTAACPYPAPTVTGLVGLAGIYDALAAEPYLEEFFDGSPTENAEKWRSGDPVALVEGAPAGLEVLLLHGDADDVVPLSQSQAFEAALEAAGVPVRLDVVPGADHLDLFTADVAAEPIEEWVSRLAAAQE